MTSLTALKGFPIESSDLQPLTNLKYLFSPDTRSRECFPFLTGLEELEIANVTIEDTPYLRNLKYLALDSTELSSETWVHLPVLESVNFDRVTILGKLPLLEGIKSITSYLSCSDNRGLEYLGDPELLKMPNLTSFHLHPHNISGTVTALTRLQELTITNKSTLTGEELRRLTSLRKLAIYDNDHVIEQLSALTSLTYLELMGTSTCDRQLSRLTNLTGISFSSIENITPEIEPHLPFLKRVRK